MFWILLSVTTLGVAGAVWVATNRLRTGGITPTKSCCPPGSIDSKNAKQAGATSEPTGTELLLPNTLTRCYVTTTTTVPIRGVVILFHDIFGVSSGRTRLVADEIASWGYFVVLPDFFDDHAEALGDGHELWDLKRWFRGGVGGTLLQRAMAPFELVEQRMLQEILPYIDSQGYGNLPLGLAGFCWGGWAITRLASWPKVRGVVGFHPSPDVQALQKCGPTTNEMYEQIQCPVLYLPGSNDPGWIKPMGKAFASILVASPESRCVDFPSMDHGWVNRGDVRIPAIKIQVDLAMQLAKDFFHHYV
ncbi:hypothetical protein BASA81_002231 [Batrachochytrium salamandrivorans]|nr:hypothetical protein BASA81_002231 [Batrachochytrium salamandrivorans]